MGANGTRNGHVTHRATEEMVSLVEAIRDAMERESGVRPSRSQVVELAIRQLARAKRVHRRAR